MFSHSASEDDGGMKYHISINSYVLYFCLCLFIDLLYNIIADTVFYVRVALGAMSLLLLYMHLWGKRLYVTH